MDSAPQQIKRLLIVVTSDPVKSGRLAEAIRLAAGISAWQKVAVTLFVGGEAVNGLLPGEGRFFDEDNIVEFLPALAERNQELYVEAGHPLVAANRTEIAFPELDHAGLAELTAGQDYVMHF
ncbi:hypothetical protein GC207_14615 [bacterium]|nr:hypothetical protein [bacterium]